jgi:hypothetical protein
MGPSCHSCQYKNGDKEIVKGKRWAIVQIKVLSEIIMNELLYSNSYGKR